MAQDMTAGVSGAGDQGGIVLGWLMRVTIVLVLMGVLAFDVVLPCLHQCHDRR